MDDFAALLDSQKNKSKGAKKTWVRQGDLAKEEYDARKAKEDLLVQEREIKKRKREEEDLIEKEKRTNSQKEMRRKLAIIEKEREDAEAKKRESNTPVIEEQKVEEDDWTDEYITLTSSVANNQAYPAIHNYYKHVLKVWAGKDRKDGLANQVSLAFIPLFEKLRHRSLDKDILPNITEIVYCSQRREYNKANDAYLRLSIGNAAWPIGVTAVGIHERSSRERINTNQVAHVLNDDKTRKWVQGIKRCLTFAEQEWPAD